MSRQVTKAMENRYCIARLRAAKYNDDFATRSAAIEHLPGVTEDSLKKYELDITRPPNIVVALMADAYNEPELRTWYCVHECPLGRNCREIDDMPPERALLRLINSTNDLEKPIRQLSKIMEDGELTDKEVRIIPLLHNQLLECRRRIDENLVALEKAERAGRFM